MSSRYLAHFIPEGAGGQGVAEVAAGSGSALGASVHVIPNTGLASGTGQALDPAISAGSSVSASAQTATGTGTAYDATARIDAVVSAGLATGTAASYAATPFVKPTAGSATGAVPLTSASYVGFGTVSQTTSTATPGYPAGIAAGDLLLIQVEVKTDVSVNATSDGFTNLAGAWSAGTHGQGSYYLYKWATGSEAGTASVAVSAGTTGTYAVMSAYRGIGGAPGAPTRESESWAGSTGTTLTHPNLISTVSGSLGVVYHTTGHDHGTTMALTGETGGDWDHRYSGAATAGNDGSFALNTVAMPSPTTVSGGTVVVSGTLRKTTYALVFNPPPSEAFDPTPSVAVGPAVATGSGQAYDATASTGAYPEVDANAEVASGTGSAYDATVAIQVRLESEIAYGVGEAFGLTTDILTESGEVTGVGVAEIAAARVDPNAELSTGSGQAYDATVSTQVLTLANAGLASGTGTAYAASTPAVVQAEIASGTGAAYDATTRSEVVAAAAVASGTGAAFAVSAHVTVNAGLASGTGEAFGASHRSVVQAEVASGTGAGYGAAPYVAVNTATTTGTGSALDPTVVSGVFTNVSAELVSGTGAAYDITTLVVVNAGLAAGTGTAQAATGAQVISASFGLDAEISLPGDTHDRREAHFGTQDDTTITIIEPLGPLPAGTTLDVVLAYLYGEVVTLDGGLYFGLDAWIDIYIGLDAVIQDEMTDSFGLDAWVVGGASFGLSAIVKASRGTTFGLDAVIHSPSEPWNVAYAPFGGGEVSYDAVTTNYQPPSQAANGILHYNFFGDAWEKGSASAVGDWWKVTWTVPQTINRVVIYNTEYSFGPTGFLEFSDGSQVPYTGLLPGTRDVEADWNTSFVLTIDFAAKVTSSLRVVSNGGGSSRVALAEVEIFNTDQWED